MSTLVRSIPLPDDSKHIITGHELHAQRRRLQLEVVGIHQHIRTLHAERKQCKRRGIAREYELKVREARRCEEALQHRLYGLGEELAVLGNEILKRGLKDVASSEVDLEL